MNNFTFPQRLKSLRKTHKKTQSDMAALLNITVRQYQSYEAGQAHPPFNSLITIADHFDVSLDYLTGRSDDPSPPQTLPVESVKKLYDVIARAKDLPEGNLEDIADTIDALIDVHLKRLRDKKN